MVQALFIGGIFWSYFVFDFNPAIFMISLIIVLFCFCSGAAKLFSASEKYF